MMRSFYLLLLLVLSLAALFFVGINRTPVEIEFAVTHVQISLGLALVLATVLGLWVGMLVRGAWMAALLAERGRLRRALKAAEAKARAIALAGEESVKKNAA